MSGHTITTLIDFLKVQDEMIRKVVKDKSFRSLPGFVVEEGIEFTPAERPKNVRQMTMQECFSNALHLSMQRPELIYCEGYATSIIPVQHAWCVTAEGIVVDPTWGGELAGKDYIGIPMQLDFVKRYVGKRGYYGVIDDWQSDFPMLRGKYKKEEYFHPAFMKDE